MVTVPFGEGDVLMNKVYCWFRVCQKVPGYASTVSGFDHFEPTESRAGTMETGAWPVVVPGFSFDMKKLASYSARRLESA